MRGVHAARAVLLATGLAACGQAAAGEFLAATVGIGAVRQPIKLGELGEARMPSGYASFCARQPLHCTPLEPAPHPIVLSPANRALLDSVNTSINRSVASTTDEELYGLVEYWTFPQEAGDCEDYVLLKRKTLAASGIPLGSLLITVVQDENGEGHAVLSVPTASGDLVLDNRRDEILHWAATGYKFVKRQSAANPNMWVALGSEELRATDIASGPEARPAD